MHSSFILCCQAMCSLSFRALSITSLGVHCKNTYFYVHCLFKCILYFSSFFHSLILAAGQGHIPGGELTQCTYIAPASSPITLFLPLALPFHRLLVPFSVTKVLSNRSHFFPCVWRGDRTQGFVHAKQELHRSAAALVLPH